jgi:hypothetical protein
LAIAQLFPLRLIVTVVFAGKWSLLSNRLYFFDDDIEENIMFNDTFNKIISEISVKDLEF